MDAGRIERPERNRFASSIPLDLGEEFAADLFAREPRAKKFGLRHFAIRAHQQLPERMAWL
jgi:hypothetical protein